MRTRRGTDGHRTVVLALASLLVVGALGVVGMGPAGLTRPSGAQAAENPRPAWTPRALVMDCLGSWGAEFGVDDDAAAEKLSDLGFDVDRYEDYAAPDYVESIPWPHWTLAELFRQNEYNVVVYYGHGGNEPQTGWGFSPNFWDPDDSAHPTDDEQQKDYEQDYRYPLEYNQICEGRNIWETWKDRNGTQYSFRLAPNAMVLFGEGCFSHGVDAHDFEADAPLLSDAEVLHRINEYSYTFLHREFPGAGTYVAYPPGGVTSFLGTLAQNPNTPIGLLAVPDYSSSGVTLLEGAHTYMGDAGMRYRKNRFQGTTNSAVWANAAWAGDPNATFRTVTGGYVPGDLNGDGDNTDPGELGFVPNPRDAFVGEDPSFNFFPFLSIANPTGTGTTAEVTFYDEAGEYLSIYRDVPANTRITLDLNANPHLRDKNLAIRVKSLDAAVPLLAERPMYFRYRGWMDGASDAFGATEGSTSWYFAEGYTSDSFDEYVCLANFGDKPANGKMTLYREGAPPLEVGVSVPARARQTHAIDGYAQGNVSIKVETDTPIVAERSMYFRYFSRNGFYSDGGHTKRGLTELGTSWYLAEGYVAENFEEWVLLVNPNPKEAKVKVAYYTSAGKHSEQIHTLAPNSRHTVFVNESFDPPTNVSVGVESVNGVPIGVERSMYFSYNGWADDGHVSPGVNQLSREWYFAEGSTFSGISEYLLVVNPGNTPAKITATYLLGAGNKPHTVDYHVGANSRMTVNVNAEMAALGYPAEVGLKLSSTEPVVAERAMYFDMGRAYGDLEPIRGGHVSLGSAQPAVEWSFAEAYTGM